MSSTGEHEREDPSVADLTIHRSASSGVFSPISPSGSGGEFELISPASSTKESGQKSQKNIFARMNELRNVTKIPSFVQQLQEQRNKEDDNVNTIASVPMDASASSSSIMTAPSLSQHSSLSDRPSDVSTEPLKQTLSNTSPVTPHASLLSPTSTSKQAPAPGPPTIFKKATVLTALEAMPCSQQIGSSADKLSKLLGEDGGTIGRLNRILNHKPQVFSPNNSHYLSILATKGCPEAARLNEAALTASQNDQANQDTNTTDTTTSATKEDNNATPVDATPVDTTPVDPERDVLVGTSSLPMTMPVTADIETCTDDILTNLPCLSVASDGASAASTPSSTPSANHAQMYAYTRGMPPQTASALCSPTAPSFMVSDAMNSVTTRSPTGSLSGSCSGAIPIPVSNLTRKEAKLKQLLGDGIVRHGVLTRVNLKGVLGNGEETEVGSMPGQSNIPVSDTTTPAGAPERDSFQSDVNPPSFNLTVASNCSGDAVGTPVARGSILQAIAASTASAHSSYDDSFDDGKPLLGLVGTDGAEAIVANINKPPPIFRRASLLSKKPLPSAPSPTDAPVSTAASPIREDGERLPRDWSRAGTVSREQASKINALLGEQVLL